MFNPVADLVSAISDTTATITDGALSANVTDAVEVVEASDIEASTVSEATEANTPEPPPMRILRIKDCASLSGRSTLTYHIGISEADSNASAATPHLRIFANTAKGYFCKDWVSMALIDLLLTEAKSFSSGDVQRLFFQGKSVNSGGFVLAALRNEGLIGTSEGSLRSYERLDPTAWQLEVLALMEAGVALSEHQAPDAPPVVAKSTKKGKAPKALAPKALASQGPEPTKKKPA